MAPAQLEVEFGPTTRTALDALEYAISVAELIPDWHEAERDELVGLCEALRETMCRTMRVQ